jgi:hypothetical protein
MITLGMVGASIGGAAGVALVAHYQEWKANRREITLVPDGKGGQIDKLKIIERRIIWTWVVATIVIVAFGYVAISAQ